MSSIKCDRCGLVNFSDAENCKRCKASFAEQQLGAWRDRWWLVKKVSAQLQERCIKCSESEDITYKPVSVKAYSAWSLVTQIAGIRLFRMIPVDVPLCRRHRSRIDMVAFGIIAAGLVMGALGIALMTSNTMFPIALFMAGIFLVMPAGLISYVIRREAVKVWKYNAPYVWLWGVHKSYLETLPEWSKR